MGRREDGEAFVTVDGKPLPERHDLRNHSPTGLEWGYAGSGPAQLALALLADAVGDDQVALDNYMEFKFRVVAKLPRDGWGMTDEDVLAKLRELQQQ